MEREKKKKTGVRTRGAALSAGERKQHLLGGRENGRGERDRLY